MPQLRISSCWLSRAAHWSQPIRAGEPSVIESPSAATTVRALVGAAIGLLRDLSAVVLPDEVVAVAAREDCLDVGNVVAGSDRKVMRVRAKLLVLGVRHVNPVDARGIAALADQIERLRAQIEALRERLDSLVHLAEDSLVEGDPVFSGLRHTLFTITT